MNGDQHVIIQQELGGKCKNHFWALFDCRQSWHSSWFTRLRTPPGGQDETKSGWELCADPSVTRGGGGQREDDRVPWPVCDESHPNNIRDNFLHVTPAGDASHADLGTPWKDRQTRRAGEREEGRRRGGEGRGDVLDWRMFLESWCNYWVSFQCDRSHDKNDNNARPPSEFSECAPLFMLMTQLPMLGWLCSQAWNKLRGGCRQHFHCIPPVAVPITTASPILSPPTADQMLMAHAALRWLTIISLASTAHINRVTVGTGRLKCY